MGLQDLLAVVLGVKTAEALEERRKAQADLVALRPRTPAERRAAVDQLMAANEPLQARFRLAASPIIEAIDPLDLFPPDRRAGREGRPSSDSRPDGMVIFIAGIYAAHLAQGDPDRYRRAITDVTLVTKSFEVNTQWAGELQSKYGALFDRLVDVHLDEVSCGLGDSLRQIRRNLRLPPLTRLPTSKTCPRCAETIKAAAAVCRFCGYEYEGQTQQRVAGDPENASGPTGAVEAAAPAWAPTHRVPDEGMAAWTAPDPSLSSAVTLGGRLDLLVAERAGDWARVVAVNGWTGWVDGRRLVSTAAPTPSSFRISSPEAAMAQFQVAYERIEGVVIDDVGAALDSAVEPEEALAQWATLARSKLRECRDTMRGCREWNPRPEADSLFEQIDVALEAYDAATAAFIERQPDGRDLLDRAVSEWEVVRSMVEAMAGY